MTSVALLDSNVLIALTVADHVHHDVAERWFEGRGRAPYATCPITQGALIRLLIRNGVAADAAVSVLASIASDRRHRFWADELPYSAPMLRSVIGHRQVADAYLVSLARSKPGRLVTLDRGLAVADPAVVELIEPR